MQHIRYIAKALDFAAVGYQEGAYFGREDLERAVQVDLLIKRDDRVFVLCEIKYSENLGPQVITEVKRKIENFPNPKGYPIQPVLISAFGPGRSVREQGYFSKILGLDIFFTSL